jgi:trimethylamine--corrinoid protein Co-methyltransferase
MARVRVNETMNSGAHYARLSRDQARRLHDASLEILARTGARLHHQRAIDLLAKAGASVTDGNLVRVGPGLVERAFSSVPRRITLYDREGHAALPLDAGRCFYGTGSDCLRIIDHRNGERRKPVLQDLVDGVRLCDALPNIDFVMSMFLPADVDPMVTDRLQLEAMLNNTTKPLVYVTNEFSGTVDAVAMLEAAAGGAEALALRPNGAHYINVTTGLQHNEEALQKLLYLAERNLPAIYAPVVISSISGPETVAGSVALINAGVMLGLVLSQLEREGAPFIVPGWGAEGLDMRTAINPYCAPDPRGTMHALGQLHRLPIFGLGGCSDSKLVDQQAAAEAALTLVFETLGGANLIHDLGYLESGLCFSLAQLAICDELVGWVERVTAPLEISEETLALDLIDEIGPDGQFLDSDHTLVHCRDRWHPRLFDRGDLQQWQSGGEKSLGEQAAARVQELLDGHEPTPLSAEARQAVHAVIERATAQQVK